MATYREWTFSFPRSLIEDVHEAAASEGVAANSFVVQAVAEKVAYLRGRNLLRHPTPEEQLAYLQARAALGDPEEAKRILAKAGTTNEILPGDELPEGWPGSDADAEARERAPADGVPAK